MRPTRSTRRWMTARNAGSQKSGNFDADALTTLSCVRNDDRHFRLDYSNFETCRQISGDAPAPGDGELSILDWPGQRKPGENLFGPLPWDEAAPNRLRG